DCGRRLAKPHHLEFVAQREQARRLEPTIGTPLATNGVRACTSRAASAFARSTCPVARYVRPQHSAGAPRLGQATATRWPAACSTRRAACSTFGSKLLEKVSAKITTVASRSSTSVVARNVSLRHLGRLRALAKPIHGPARFTRLNSHGKRRAHGAIS